jgi:3-hydroxybutyryl-CoA dehydrogenase
MVVAVIGAGVQGRAFALACARAGFTVILEDVMPDKLRQARTELARLHASVHLVTTVEDAVRDADIAVDFVPDELESKLEILSLLDRMAPPRTVLCTPSENLSITDLASCTYRGDRCVMLRGRLDEGSAVRVLTGRETSEATLKRTRELLDGLGCTAMVEPDPDLPMLLKNMHASVL